MVEKEGSARKKRTRARKNSEGMKIIDDVSQLPENPGIQESPEDLDHGDAYAIRIDRGSMRGISVTPTGLIGKAAFKHKQKSFKFIPKERPRYFEEGSVEESQAPGKISSELDHASNKGSKSKDSLLKKDSGDITDLSKIDVNTGIRKNKKRDKKGNKMENESPAYGKRLRELDPFPGDAPIPKKKLQTYKRGNKIDTSTVRTKFHQKKFKSKEEKFKKAVRQAARMERLLPEESGFIEADEGEDTSRVTQHEIADAVDITSATKFFDLKLDSFGPYRLNYTRNGRFLLLGGARGHVSALDWQTKKLMCEMNVMESINDVKWLHIETMFAVAQKRWTYIYDNQGIELHCLKNLDHVLRMEFLPHHFLLATANAKSYLSWLDVSVGQKVAGFGTGLGRLDVMCQNPNNAIIHLGHSGGTVTLWSPNIKEPLVKMLCHGSGTRAITVDPQGRYMATSGIDRKIKIWDLRTYKMMQSYRVAAGPGQLSFSQRGLLAAGIGNIVEIYNDCITSTAEKPYLSHRCPKSVQSLQFSPYEDVLGVGHGAGFSSLLVPGAGEPNYDALEANPYQSKKQRREAEVKMLLEKIKPGLISLDTSALGQLNTKTIKEQMEEKSKLLWVKPQKIDFEPKHKKKGKSKTGRFERRKKGVKEEAKKREYRELKKAQIEENQQAKELDKPYNVFDRFKTKD